MSEEMAKDFVFEKLRGSDNFHTWNFAVKNVLALKGLEQCISLVDSEREKDAKKLRECKAILSLSVEPPIYVHIQNCESAIDIWKALQKLYETKGLTRKIGLLRNLISTRLDGCDNMQQYIDGIIGCSNKLTGIGFDISDEWIGAILLAGLTENYMPFIMGIEASDGNIKSDAIIAKLLDSQPNANASGEALIGQKKKFNKNKKETRECFNCGKKGHLKKACKKKKQDDGDGKARTAFIACARGTQQYDWYVDSGASSHMTPHSSLLSNMRPADVKQIISANNAKMSVRNAGNTRNSSKQRVACARTRGKLIIGLFNCREWQQRAI